MNFVIGDRVVFDSSWEYMGPLYQFARIRVSIGQKVLGIFDELLFDDVGITQGASPDFGPFSMRQSITLRSPLSPGNAYSIEAKIYEGTGPLQKIYSFFELANVINIPEIVTEPDFRNLRVDFSKG